MNDGTTDETFSLVVRLAALGRQGESDLAAVGEDGLDDWRVRYLGRKGLLADLSDAIKTVAADERPAAGREMNRVKNLLQTAYDARASALAARRLAGGLASEQIDVTLPGRRPTGGYTHPQRDVLDEIVRIFADMGFSVAEGPEVEWERYNFELLNIPADHPARDAMDTLYIDSGLGLLLRTQTSPVQVRTMEKQEPPVRVIAPGLCYRRDAEDASHLVAFYQCEGLAVDRDVTFADLKGTLSEFARRIFGARTRFRPHHFPFTEPSAEIDFSCTVCGGKGCRTCKYEGWLEIGGCGMVHPRVLRNMRYDPAVYSGFAFGLGPERVAMLKYGIPDLRLFYSNDLRFLEQFR